MKTRIVIQSFIWVICFSLIGCASTLRQLPGQCIEGDCLNGKGTMTFPNHIKYVGQFKDGMPNGQGTMVFANDRKWEGHWKDGRIDGEGYSISPYGTKRRTLWKKGKPIGYWLDENDDQSFVKIKF